MKMRLHFEKRKTYSPAASVLTPIVSFFVSLVLTAVVLAAVKLSPLHIYAAMFQGAFGSWRDFTETLVKAIPLFGCLQAAFLEYRSRRTACSRRNWGGMGCLILVSMDALASSASGSSHYRRRGRSRLGRDSSPFEGKA